jgi:hypothetical protein
MKPVCVPCQRFFRAKKNGFYFIEGMPVGGVARAEPGTDHPEQWEPYKLWVGDLYECEGCGAQTIVGVPHVHLAEHYQPDFTENCKRFNATFQVNDC